MKSPTVFISYSHKDEEWKDRLVTQLGVLQHEGLLNMWDDRKIGAGDDWYKEIEDAIAGARVAVLMVSANFLTSNFILNEEVPRLLERCEKQGVRIFPVIVKPCAWTQVKWLARMQARPKDGKPLSAGSDYQIDVDLATIAEEIANIVRHVESTATTRKASPAHPKPASASAPRPGAFAPGGVTINAETVNISGDIVGRDKREGHASFQPPDKEPTIREDDPLLQMPPAQLHKLLCKNFSLDELRLLCLGIQGLDWDALAGETKDRKALELIGYMQRRGRLIDLVTAIRRTRSNI